MKLSAVVIALNEEKNIAGCVAALAFADEILVVDGGSGDRTVEIATAAGARVLRRPFDDFASQKNFAIDSAIGEWVLSVDADERVGRELAAEIRRTIGSGESPAAYSMLRRTRLFGRVFRFAGLQHDRPIRLFKRGQARFEGAVHERLVVDGGIGRIRGVLDHASFQSLNEYWRRLQTYTSLESDRRARPLTPGKMTARAGKRFLSVYLVGQGFRDGLEGFFYSVLSSYYEFVRWAKIWEKEKSHGR